MRITKQTKFLNTTQFFELYTKLIKDTSRGTRIKKDGKRIRVSTIDNYIYIQKLLHDFVTDTKHDIRLYIVTHLTAKEKEQAKKYYKKFFAEFTDYLYVKKDLYDILSE